MACHDQEIFRFSQDHFWNLDKTEFRVPPKLIIQIWDNDKFSLDDYLGKTVLLSIPFSSTDLLLNLKHQSLFSVYVPVTGSVELDLLSLIPPAKSPEKCSLKMLPGMVDSASSKKPPPNSLFSQKSVRGWWPCVNEQDGKHVLGVCFSAQHSP